MNTQLLSTFPCIFSLGEVITLLHFLLSQIPFGLSASAHSTLYVSDWGRQEVISYDVNTGQETVMLSHVSEPMAVFYSPVRDTLPGMCN